MTDSHRARGKRFVRVLCTLGPASLQEATIRRLEERDVDLFRINLSHTALEQVAPTIELIQSFSSVPVCLDTEGAQVRTGKMVPDVVVSDAAHVRLTPEHVVGTAEQLTLTPASVFDELEPGNLIGLDFDGVVLLVVEKDAAGVNTIVLNGGRIGSNKAAVVTPAPQLPALSAKDRAAVAIGREYGLTHFALSFTNSADDVAELRELVGAESTIISKIESKRGVLNLDEILAAADEILIDRGDLSREVPLENIPLLQKAIIRKANLNKVPVNVATNLLESMLVNRKPTRAELNDIINTLLDGANGLVLAAETAIGQHPVGAVDMVLNMIDRHRRSVEGHRIEDLLEAGPVLHGRTALSTFPSRRKSRLSNTSAAKLPAIEIDQETLLDVEQITSGVYAPLRGFMTQSELASVLEVHRLPSGEIWTMPIVLQGKGQEFAAFHPGQSVRLVDERTGQAVAILHLEDKYEIDPQQVAQNWFGTTDRSHAGVRRFVNRGLTLLGGELEALPHAATSRSPYQLTPAQARMLLDIKGWSKVVAFHARSLPDRGREHLLAHAAERSHADGVLIQVAVGPQQPGEIASEVVLSAYQRLVQLAYPNSLLSALGTYERHAGARETVFAALVSRNFGCTHFVVGRNRADRELFEQLGDIGITPVVFDEVCFSEEQGATVERNGHRTGLREFSTNRLREYLANIELIPAWTMRDELANWLLAERTAGAPLFTHPEQAVERSDLLEFARGRRSDMSTVTNTLVGVKPNFLFIGADRCGSKSLHNFFRQHPECYVPPIADPYFFDKHYDRGLDWYLSLFADASPSARAIGEFSHDYIHSPEAAERIAWHFPDIQLLATLRHPIERTFSSYASAQSAGVIRTSFEQALDEVPMLISGSLYADKLRVYYDQFPAEQLKVLFFDDLEADPKAFAGEAFGFVGLPLVETIDYGERKSVLSKSRFPLSGPLSKLGATTLRRLGWVNLLGQLKSNTRFRALFYQPYAADDKPQVAPETRKRLGAVFAPQIDALEKMLGRDLTAWRT